MKRFYFNRHLLIASIAVAGLGVPLSASAQIPDWNPPAKTTVTKTAKPKATVSKTTSGKTGENAVVKKDNTETKSDTKKTVPDFTSPEVPKSTTVFSAEPKVKSTKDFGNELTSADLSLASDIRKSGPLEGYKKHLATGGILFDDDGGTPSGQNSAEVRFKEFPPSVIMIRIPQRAIAGPGNGSSWGEYKVYNGSALISSGRYQAAWRKENGEWKLFAELVAGKIEQNNVLPTKPKTPAKVNNDANAANTIKKEKEKGLFNRSKNVNEK